VNQQQVDAIGKWRRYQVLSVAAGNLFTIVFLVGLSLDWIVLIGLGLVGLTGSLGMVGFGGIMASMNARWQSKP